MLCLAVLFAAIGFLWINGINVKTTPESFVTRHEMPLFEMASQKMNIRMAPTPAAWPEETATMYRAAHLGIPVSVELKSKGSETVHFWIRGLSKEGDFLVPCISFKECRRILQAAQMEIPEQLLMAGQ